MAFTFFLPSDLFCFSYAGEQISIIVGFCNCHNLLTVIFPATFDDWCPTQLRNVVIGVLLVVSVESVLFDTSCLASNSIPNSPVPVDSVVLSVETIQTIL